MKLHKGKYLHGEAFALMKYATKDGAVVETLWNSRDGVTPFILHSVDGKHELSHVDWQGDRCAPSYVPAIGSRMFVDLTKERMLEFKREFVELYWDAEGEYKLKDHPELGPLGKEGTAIRLAYDEWQDGQPDVAEVTQEVLDDLRRVRNS